MKPEPWNLWERPQLDMGESRLLRYGVAIVLPIAAAAVVFMRPAFRETPFFVFLCMIVMSAAYGGLASAFVSTALSALLIRLFFVEPTGSLLYRDDLVGIERMFGFVLRAMMLSSFVAAIRRERNHLRDSEKRYRLLAESASDAILVIDQKVEIVYLNPAAETLFGTPAGQLIGQNLARLLPGNGYQARIAEMKHHLDSSKQAVALRLPGLHVSGKPLLIEMTLGTSSHRGRNLFTAIMRDVGGLKRS